MILDWLNPLKSCVEYKTSSFGSGQKCFIGDNSYSDARDAQALIGGVGSDVTITQSNELSLPRLSLVVGAAALVGYAIWQKTHGKKVLGLADKPSKPKGNIISKDKAVHIASEWHGGQWSALYSLASSKEYDDKQYKRYVSEISNEMQRDTGIHKRVDENKHMQKVNKDLNNLMRWIDYKHWECNKV